MYSIVLAKSGMHSIHYLSIQIETEKGKGKRERQRDRERQKGGGETTCIYAHTSIL